MKTMFIMVLTFACCFGISFKLFVWTETKIKGLKKSKFIASEPCALYVDQYGQLTTTNVHSKLVSKQKH